MIKIIVNDIVPILVIMALGYICGRVHYFDDDQRQGLNKVVLDIALPAALFVSIVKATREMLASDLVLTILSLVGVTGMFMLSYLLCKKLFHHTTQEAAVCALIAGSPTIGFLGFAVLEPIFGTTPYVALVVAIVGIVVNAVGIPVGLSLLNNSLNKTRPLPAGQKRPSAWSSVLHALAQPVAWAPILAVIWVIAGIPWPKWLSPSFDLIKGANASMAVFAAGITLSAFKITINWQAILGCLLKMVMMPAALLIVGIIFHMQLENLKMLVIAGALPPAFSGIIIADEYDQYVATGTTSLTLSVILFIGFCPLWLWITELCTHSYGF